MKDLSERKVSVLLRRLGLMPYAQAFELQRGIVERLVAEPDAPGELLIVTHPDVVTLGRATKADHLPLSEDELRARGIEVARTDRGGSVTYHGPGQIVLYPVLPLWQFKKDLALHLRRLEDVAIATIAAYGLLGARLHGMTGVWLDCADGQRKVCAMGIGVRHWVTYHGLALNVAPDLSRFDLFIPCGLHGFRVTSMREKLGEKCPAPAQVEETMIAAFRDVFVARIEDAPVT